MDNVYKACNPTILNFVRCMIYMLSVSLSVLLHHHIPLILQRLTLSRNHSDTEEKHSNFSDTLYFPKT
jgi:hypothetical protein